MFYVVQFGKRKFDIPKGKLVINLFTLFDRKKTKDTNKEYVYNFLYHLFWYFFHMFYFVRFGKRIFDMP